MAVIVTTSVCIFALKNKENVVYGAEEASARFNPETLQDNEHMHVEIDESGEKVPVPNGYIGSKATGENEIDTGYVIYEGEEVNDSNVEEAQKTRNQYVWIPVPDASKMYGTDENGKKWGKLYDFTTEEGERIDSVTGAKPTEWREQKYIDVTNSPIKEPFIKNYTGTKTPYDMDSNTKNSAHKFLNQLEQEFNSMINSVEKYGGFYIGRYETGNLTLSNAVVVKNNKETGSQNWYEQYLKCKKLKNKNLNIETGMIWGSQWDRTLMWLIESGNRTKEEICEDSTSWGNYKNSTFSYEDTNGTIYDKENGKNWLIPTGNSEYTKANNIYDLAGNVWEWTMESGDGRRFRGGSYIYEGYNRYVSCRLNRNPNDIGNSIRLQSNVIYKII